MQKRKRSAPRRSPTAKASPSGETLLRAVFDNALEAMLIADDQGNYVDANAAACELFGVSRDELLASNLTRFVEPSRAPEVAAAWRAFLDAGEQQGLFQLRRADGAIRDLEYNARANILPGLHLSILRDVTERQRTARALSEQAEELAAANRAKDEFLATVSHELRTPLSAIIGWSRMLRTGRLDQETRDHALETIERNVRLQTQIVEDILDVSHIVTGKLHLVPQAVALAPIIEAAAAALRPAAEAKAIEITLSLSSDSILVNGDANRLQQVFWNLLANAVKFTPAGGRVAVRLEREDECALVFVSDTGQGIDREFLPFAFDYFRQADASSTRLHGGLGLGLAIVRHIVEMHGGTVTAESAGEGCGATFTVSLPLRREDGGALVAGAA